MTKILTLVFRILQIGLQSMVSLTTINKPCSQVERENTQLLVTLVRLKFIIWGTKFTSQRFLFLSLKSDKFNKTKDTMRRVKLAHSPPRTV